MNSKTHTPSPSENSEALPSPNARHSPPEKTGRKGAVPRGAWLDGSMIGRRFGKLTVLAAGTRPSKRGGSTKVPCVCDCGETVEKRSGNLDEGSRCRRCFLAHMSQVFTTHGQHPRDVFRIWGLMKNRCFNPNADQWAQYGGRGITVCRRWESFVAFRDDMGPRPSPKHTLERVNNDLGYFPENCRWATMREQCRNRRSSKNITAFGQTKTLAEWAEESPVSYGAIQYRLKNGWSAEDAIQKPNQKIFP